jgi:hypothetical protein
VAEPEVVENRSFPGVFVIFWQFFGNFVVIFPSFLVFFEPGVCGTA